jgi:hypothetical protein
MRTAATAAAAPDLSIVCCIEAGRLEEQTVLMVRSLRTFGGAFADVPVIAVIGRIGPALRDRTQRELGQLGVRIVRAKASANPAKWLNYANKVAAVLTADQIAQTGQVAWFDSDMFVLQEPSEILLRGDEDLAAQCHHLPPAVLEGDDTHISYWSKVCALFGVDFDRVPWTRAADNLPQQKLNFTSGLFTWRRGSRFAPAYFEAVQRLIRARIAQATGEFFTFDQVVLTPLIVANRFKWKRLAVRDHSIVLGPFLESKSAHVPNLSDARILHYSNSFTPAYRALMEQRLTREVPAFAAWLQAQQLDLGELSLPARLFGRLLRAQRALRYRVYARSTTAAA